MKASDSEFPIGGSGRFHERVLAAARRVPPGRVATYGDLAAAAGRPRAARAVGNIMREARAPGVPYHRIVAAGGRLGGYGGNEALKGALLRAEGVMVAGERIRNFRSVRWTSNSKGSKKSRGGGPKGSKAPKRG